MVDFPQYISQRLRKQQLTNIKFHSDKQVNEYRSIFLHNNFRPYKLIWHALLWNHFLSVLDFKVTVTPPLSYTSSLPDTGSQT